jgi:hypothetical protein
MGEGDGVGDGVGSHVVHSSVRSRSIAPVVVPGSKIFHR